MITLILIFITAILLVKGNKMFGKLFSVFKSKVNSAGEQIIDKNKIDLFKQKIREAEESLSKMIGSKSDIMAHIKKTQREIEDIRLRINQNETIVKSCLEKQERELALEVADKIGDLEQELKINTINIEKLNKADELIETKRSQVSNKINSMKQNIAIYESQESVNNALKKTAGIVGESISLDPSSLDMISKEIEDTQSFQMDKFISEQEIYNKDIKGDLSKKLEDKGILSKNYSSEDILKRYET